MLDLTLYNKMQREKRTLHRRNYLIKKNGSISRTRKLLELSTYEHILQNQKGVCKICHNKPKGRLLSIDHDHKTGIVRGLLCFKCNSGLSLFNDNKNTLLSAIKYLETDSFITNLNNKYK